MANQQQELVYISYGPSPLTKSEIPYMESNLLENILNTADTCIVKKENSVTLRLGHESCLLPSVCLLELGDCAKQTADRRRLQMKLGEDYKIFPMAGNVQFVFFRKKGSDDIRCKGCCLNEHEMKASGRQRTGSLLPLEGCGGSL